MVILLPLGRTWPGLAPYDWTHWSQIQGLGTQLPSGSSQLSGNEHTKLFLLTDRPLVRRQQLVVCDMYKKHALQSPLCFWLPRFFLLFSVKLYSFFFQPLSRSPEMGPASLGGVKMYILPSLWNYLN